MSPAPIDLAEHRKRRAAIRREQRGFDAAAAVQRIKAQAEHSTPPPFGPGDVPCARCGAPVASNARRCLHCGVHFSGHAEDHARDPRKTRWTTVVIVVLLILCMVLGGLMDWTV